MTNHPTDRFSDALSGLTRIFRSAVDRTDCRVEAPRQVDRRQRKHKPVSDAHVRQLAAVLDRAVIGHARIEAAAEGLIGARSSLPEVTPMLLARYAETLRGAFLRSPGVSDDLVLLAAMFDGAHEEYLRAVGVVTVDVDIGGRMRGDGIEIAIPRVADGSSWDVVSSGAATSHVWLVLPAIKHPETRVRIRLTWAGRETVGAAELTTSGPELWSRTALPPGVAWSAREATLLRSTSHRPEHGSVELRVRITAEDRSRCTHDCSIRVDLGEARSEPPLRPRNVTVSDAQPTPAYLPRELVANLAPAQRLQLIELFGDFVGDQLRTIRELRDAIGADLLDPDLVRSAAELSSVR